MWLLAYVHIPQQPPQSKAFGLAHDLHEGVAARLNEKKIIISNKDDRFYHTGEKIPIAFNKEMRFEAALGETFYYTKHLKTVT